MKRFLMTAVAAGVLMVVPAANAGEVTVHDPVRGCDYTVGWYVNPQNPGGTNAYTYGKCTG